jgi:hypothetical protein
MSDEDFLSRWSRRKREAAQSARSAQPPAAPDTAEASPSAAPAASGKTGPANTEREEFDLASLPPIDSITAATDITAFLRKGVPLELSRAALRRAWSSDPAIRDFIGLAENAWDFNDPNAMPGFGPLDQTPEQVRELAARIIGRVREATEELADASNEGWAESAAKHSSAQKLACAADSQSPPPPDARFVEDRVTPAADGTIDAAAADDGVAMQKDEPALKVRRTHGGALPR